MSEGGTTQSTNTDKSKSGRDEQMDFAVLIAVPILSVLIIACIVILIIVCIQRKRWKNRQRQHEGEEHWPQHNNHHTLTTISSGNIRVEDNSSSPETVAPHLAIGEPASSIPSSTQPVLSSHATKNTNGRVDDANEAGSQASNDDNTQVKTPVVNSNSIQDEKVDVSSSPDSYHNLHEPAAVQSKNDVIVEDSSVSTTQPDISDNNCLTEDGET